MKSSMRLATCILIFGMFVLGDTASSLQHPSNRDAP